MWDAFNQLPIWLKAIAVLIPFGGGLALIVALIIKIIQSEKVHIGKDGVNLEDIDKIQAQQQEIIKNETKS